MDAFNKLEDISLQQYLHSATVFDDLENAIVRERMLGELHVLLQDMVRRYSEEQHHIDTSSFYSMIKLHTYGSYRLGVFESNSDIDTLCIGPQHVSREDFFEMLVRTLHTRAGDCTDIIYVREAYVPICKFKYMGVEVDLSYAQVPLPYVDETFDIFADVDRYMPHLDPKSVRSLNGSRVTDRILSVLVPEQIPTFKLALRAVKLWAQRRGVYSNILGYLGGISWALLTVFVCSSNPQCRSPYSIVCVLFGCCLVWKWPTPIRIRELSAAELAPQVPGCTPWDPEHNATDRQHLLPILTPAHPVINTTHNVSLSTKRILVREWTRAQDLFQQPSITPTELWSQLFAASDFFFLYRHYLHLHIRTQAAEETKPGETTEPVSVTPRPVTRLDDLHSSWFGFVESRLRRLNEKLESYDYVQQCHIFPRVYEEGARSPVESSEETEAAVGPPIGTKQSNMFVGLELCTESRSSIDLSSAISNFKELFREKQQQDTRLFIEVSYVKYKELPDYVFTDERRPKHTLPKRKRTAEASTVVTPPDAEKVSVVFAEPIQPVVYSRNTVSECEFIQPPVSTNGGMNGVTAPIRKITVKLGAKRD